MINLEACCTCYSLINIITVKRLKKWLANVDLKSGYEDDTISAPDNLCP